MKSYFLLFLFTNQLNPGLVLETHNLTKLSSIKDQVEEKVVKNLSFKTEEIFSDNLFQIPYYRLQETRTSEE
jgi:uncharacterized protein (UPF0216 family)